jgi:phosphoglycerol transferase MdoB-like AlkP superfamily enzyme
MFRKSIITNYYFVLLYRLAIVMLLFFICRFIFYFLNLSLFPGIQANEWGYILYGGFIFDLAALLYYNALMLVLMTIPIPYVWRTSGVYQQVVKWVFYIFNGIALLLNCVDIIYYRFTLRRTTGSVFREFSNEQNKAKLAFHFLFDYWYVTLIFIGLLFLMVWLYHQVKIKITDNSENYKLRYYLKSVFVFLISIPLVIGGIRGGFKHSTRPITISNAGEYVQRPQDVYLVLNTPFCFVRTWGVKTLKEVHYFSDAEVDKIYSPVHYPQDSLGTFKNKNVVIFILESFGKEAVGFYNKDLDNGAYTGFTPFLDSLAFVSKVYWESFANGRKSIDAIPSVITSIPSGLDPFILTPYVSDTIQSLAHILDSKGYYTSFFHGAPNGSMGFLAFTKMMGIKNYFGKDEYNNNKDFDGIWGVWDEPFFQFFEKKLNTFPQPFFSALFSVSSHDPFKVPEQYNGKFKKGPLPVLECISYTDMALRKFFIEAEKTTWFKNTLFIITADHATISYHPEYQNAWGDIAVPILLYAPGDSTFRGIDKGIIQQMDVMPTVLGYLNYDKPYVAFGENVLKRKGNGFAFQYSGGYRWFQDDYVLYFDGNKSTGLYNYKNRLSQENILKKEPARVAEMEIKLKAFIQQYNNRIVQNRLVVK